MMEIRDRIELVYDFNEVHFNSPTWLKLIKYMKGPCEA
jgi:hypothetical protein